MSLCGRVGGCAQSFSCPTTNNITTTHQPPPKTQSPHFLFKCGCLGPSLSAKCHSDICPDNICPGNICPYQEYLSCCWPDFDQTLKVGSWDHFEQIPTVTVTFVPATFVQATFDHIRNIFAVISLILIKL